LKQEKELKSDEPKETRIPTPFAVTENMIAEEIWDRKGKPKYVVRYFEKDEIEYADEIDSGTLDMDGKPVIYVPADGPALRKGLVILPREPVEGTFEEAFALGVKLAHDIYDTSNGHTAEFDFLVAVAQASWFLDRFIPDPSLQIAGMGHFAPIVALRGPSGHGKNRALSALRLNSYRPFYDQSTKRIPSLFRPLDTWRGTLCLDECDLGRSDEASEVVHYLNCRAYGTPISRQNPDNPKEAQAFWNFGSTIVTQRRAWDDDATENRTLPFLCERSQKNLATTELDQWLTRGLEVQDRLLYLRMLYWQEVMIDKAARIPGLKDHRLTASVLPILALKPFAPDMVRGLEGILKTLARRRQLVRAASSDGIVVNFLWEKLDAGLIGAHNGKLFVGASKTKSEKGRDEEVLPLQIKQMAELFKWSTRETRRIVSSTQITPEDAPRHPIHTIEGTARPIYFIPAKLEVLLADFVPDYEEGALAQRLAEAGFATLATDATVHSPLYPGEEERGDTGARTVASVASVADTAMRPTVASVANSETDKEEPKP
jgi:hypothetical protein